jgi:serine/threonine protein phosphatase PrpC
MRFSFAAASVCGANKLVNSDAACGSASMLAVADGLGSEGAAAAMDALADFADRPIWWAAGPASDPSAEFAAREAMRCAHFAMVERAERSGHHLYTSLTLLTICGERLGLLHIGGARAYRLRGDRLLQMTRDHRLMSSYIAGPPGTEEELRAPLFRVLRSDGEYEEMEPDFTVRSWEPGDRYMLCSDGLAIPTAHRDLAAALLDNPAPERAVAALIDVARRSGSPDDLTCTVADLVEDDEVPRPIRVGAATET